MKGYTFLSSQPLFEKRLVHLEIKIAFAFFYEPNFKNCWLRRLRPLSLQPLFETRNIHIIAKYLARKFVNEKFKKFGANYKDYLSLQSAQKNQKNKFFFRGNNWWKLLLDLFVNLV